MKKHSFTLLLSLLFATASIAQTALQYHAAKIISNVEQTVPAGKVWKVTAVYGQEVRVNECVDFSTTSTHEIGTRARCGVPSAPATMSGRFNYSLRTILVNNVSISFAISGFSTCPSGNLNPSSNCTGANYDCTYFSNTNFNCVNLSSDPNVLPIWLPAGTTFKTGGAKTFASVIEFTEVP